MPETLDDTPIERLDRILAGWMERWGHRVHRLGLGAMFVWFGGLKISGRESATSLIAHTVYLGTPEQMVPLLGWWEAAIGVCLLIPALVRIGILLLVVRLPGTLLALVLRSDVCFSGVPWIPTPEGQYLIKDFLLFGAALVIGGTVRREQRPPGIRH